jgi:hypothetical protein
MPGFAGLKIVRDKAPNDRIFTKIGTKFKSITTPRRGGGARPDVSGKKAGDTEAAVDSEICAGTGQISPRCFCRITWSSVLMNRPLKPLLISADRGSSGHAGSGH